MYSLPTRVRFSEADELGKLSIVGIMNLLQDCCTMQAEDLGIGLSYLRENHLGWIVTNYQIRLYGDMPAVGDEVVVSTWPYRFRGMLGYRNFSIKRGDGSLLLEADSLWMLMDVSKMNPIRLPEKMAEAYTVDPKLEGEWGRKHIQEKDNYELVYRFEVNRAHLDTNHHMNNAYYVDGAKECIAEELKTGAKITELYVEYKKSALLGDVISVEKQTEDQVVRVILRDDATKDVFAVVEFQLCN